MDQPPEDDLQQIVGPDMLQWSGMNRDINWEPFCETSFPCSEISLLVGNCNLCVCEFTWKFKMHVLHPDRKKLDCNNKQTFLVWICMQWQCQLLHVPDFFTHLPNQDLWASKFWASMWACMISPCKLLASTTAQPARCNNRPCQFQPRSIEPMQCVLQVHGMQAVDAWWPHWGKFGKCCLFFLLGPKSRGCAWLVKSWKPHCTNESMLGHCSHVVFRKKYFNPHCNNLERYL